MGHYAKASIQQPAHILRTAIAVPTARTIWICTTTTATSQTRYLAMVQEKGKSGSSRNRLRTRLATGSLFLYQRRHYRNNKPFSFEQCSADSSNLYSGSGHSNDYTADTYNDSQPYGYTTAESYTCANTCTHAYPHTNSATHSNAETCTDSATCSHTTSCSYTATIRSRWQSVGLQL